MKRAEGLMTEFREFILRGNIIDLAVAVVIGTAFGALVAALVKDLVTPLIAAIGGEPDFSGLAFTLNGSEFRYGHFLNAVIAFILVAAVLFFLVVKPVNAFIRRVLHGETEDTQLCPECLSSIPSAARRCAHCTSVVEPGTSDGGGGGGGGGPAGGGPVRTD